MPAPNMAAITESLQRSLQNCSLNHHQNSNSASGFGRSATSASTPPPGIHNSDDDDATLELNSHVSLPDHWEQCLDLKTGEVYYINWRTGMKAKEDPRTSDEYSGEIYSEDDEGSSTESSPSSKFQSQVEDDEGSSTESSPSSKFQSQVEDERENAGGGVLVVAGCKSCLMYFMVPKKVRDCPKCAGQLLHF